MREKTEKFCNDIKEEFCLYLYNKDIGFPYCCKLSADIITSFLKMACSDSFQYICTTNPKAYNHAWTYYKDGKDEFIVDFSNFQYSNSKVSQEMKNKNMSIQEFKKIVHEEVVVFNPEETFMFKAYGFMNPQRQKCFGLINGYSAELNRGDFMKYLILIFDKIFDNTSY